MRASTAVGAARFGTKRERSTRWSEKWTWGWISFSTPNPRWIQGLRPVPGPDPSQTPLRCSGGVRARHRMQLVKGRVGCGAVELRTDRGWCLRGRREAGRGDREEQGGRRGWRIVARRGGGGGGGGGGWGGGFGGVGGGWGAGGRGG